MKNSGVNAEIVRKGAARQNPTPVLTGLGPGFTSKWADPEYVSVKCFSLDFLRVRTTLATGRSPAGTWVKCCTSTYDSEIIRVPVIREV